MTSPRSPITRRAAAALAFPLPSASRQRPWPTMTRRSGRGPRPGPRRMARARWKPGGPTSRSRRPRPPAPCSTWPTGATETVNFLKAKMKPLKISAAEVRALILKLGNDNEKVWKPAFEEMEYFDPRLAIDLETLMDRYKEAPGRQRMVEVMSGREAGQLAGKTVILRGVRGDGFNFFAQPNFGSWWAEHKVERINNPEGWGNPKKKWTRAVRAIVLLEHFGTPGAVAVLKDMATGHPDAQPTRVARDALVRVGGSGPSGKPA